MKRLFYIAIILLINIPCLAQGWQYVGKGENSEALLFNDIQKYQSMKVSPSGIPYVAFQDYTNNYKTTVLSFNGSNWGAVGAVGISAGYATYQSLAISPSGVPYVAYRDNSAHHYKTTVLSFNGSNWGVVGAAGISVGSASYQSLAFSPSGTPYVAYLDSINYNKYRTTVLSFDGSNWGNVGNANISGDEYYVNYQSLAFSPSGVPYVAYSDQVSNSKTRVLSFDGSNWGAVGVIQSQLYTSTSYQSLAFSPSGIPYVAYSDGSNNDKTTVLSFDGSNWGAVGAVGISYGYAYYQSLAFSPSGVPYVAYSGYGDETTVLSFDGSNWGAVGAGFISAGHSYYQSLAFSPSGVPYVAYSDYGFDYGKTTVLSFDGNKWRAVASPSGISGESAYYQSLAFSPSGIPYVAFQDVANQYKTTVLSFDGNNWGAVGKVGVSGAGASFQSLAINTSGVPYVAYCDGGGNTTVLSFNGSNWGNVGNIDISAGGTAFQSLAISPSGVPYVAYSDYKTFNNYKTTVLSFNGSNWGPVGRIGISAGNANYQSLAISPSGVPYVAFQDIYYSGRTTVLSFDGINWGGIGPPGIGAYAFSQSLAISPSGIPYLAYSDVTKDNNFNSTVLDFNNNRWGGLGPIDMNTLDASEVYLVYTPTIDLSLAISPSGIPYVIYSDYMNNYKTTVFSFDGSNWKTVGLAGITVTTPRFLSLKINPVTGEPWVAYSGAAHGLFVQKYTAPSGTTTGITPSLTDILDSAIHIYPNPSEGNFTIGLGISEAGFTITSVEGRLLLGGKLTEGNNVMDTKLPKGVYILNIDGYTRKLVIQ